MPHGTDGRSVRTSPPRLHPRYHWRPTLVPWRPHPAWHHFGFVRVRCACYGANICGDKLSCSKCHRVVDEAFMRLVESAVQCVTCSCRACGNKVPSHTIDCKGCHFCVPAAGTTNGICTGYAKMEHPPKPRVENATKRARHPIGVQICPRYPPAPLYKHGKVS